MHVKLFMFWMVSGLCLWRLAGHRQVCPQDMQPLDSAGFWALQERL